MSIFGTNQVEEVIIGNAVATEGTVSAFKTSASEKEIKALAVDGGAAAEGKLFYLLQKTGGNAAKGLNYEFSDKVNPRKIERIVVKEYAPETQKSVSVTGFAANIKPNTTYGVHVRLYAESGSLSPENFRILFGHYSTGADVTGVTGDEIRDGILKSLKTDLVSRGDNEFVLDGSVADTLTITAQYQEVNPDKGLGRPIEFDVQTKVTNEANGGQNLGYLTAEVVANAYPGNGTGKQVVNKEWFAKGFKYSPYRGMDYPAGFDTPYQANKGGKYNAVFITYKTDRISPTVEEQPRVLCIYVETDGTPAGNAATNSLLADIRTFVGANAQVPADLAVA